LKKEADAVFPKVEGFPYQRTVSSIWKLKIEKPYKNSFNI